MSIDERECIRTRQAVQVQSDNLAVLRKEGTVMKS